MKDEAKLGWTRLLFSFILFLLLFALLELMEDREIDGRDAGLILLKALVATLIPTALFRAGKGVK